MRDRGITWIHAPSDPIAKPPSQPIYNPTQRLIAGKFTITLDSDNDAVEITDIGQNTDTGRLYKEGMGILVGYGRATAYTPYLRVPVPFGEKRTV